MLVGPGRPPIEKQREILRILGVPFDKRYPPVWLDKIERGQPGRRGGAIQLDERSALLTAVQKGDRVVIASPFCLGLSRRDAREFMTALGAKGASLVVSNDAWEIPPGGDVERLIEELARAQNTANVAAHRKRKRSTQENLMHDPKTPPIYIPCQVDGSEHRFMFVPDLEDGERVIWRASDGTCVIRESNPGNWNAIGVSLGGSPQTAIGKSAEDAAQRWVRAFVDESR